MARPELSRRSWLSRSLGGAASLRWWGLSRPAAASPRAADAASASADPALRSVIHVFLRGGLSQIDSLDPKEGGPADRIFGSIPTRVPGVHFGEGFPELAAVADRMTILRSMTHRQNEHEPGQRYVRTGRTDAGSTDPSLGAIVAHRSGWSVPPPYVAVPSSEPDAGFLGASAMAFDAVMPGDRSPTDPTAGTGVPTGRGAAALRALSRANQGRANQARGDHLGDRRGITGRLDEARRRVDSISQSPLLTGLQDIQTESAATRRQYGEGRWADYLIMARRLAEAGSRYVWVELADWDHHQDIERQFAVQAGQLDRPLAGLIADLDQRGSSDNILVMVSTEFGRDRRLEGSRSRPGRGHWSAAYSGLLFGGPTRRGAVIGRTDASGAEVREDPVSPADLWTTAADWLGLPIRSPDLLPDGRQLNVVGRSLLDVR